VGLDSGADDYVTKPCSPREILARVRAILRRTATAPGADAPPDPPLRVGELELDPAARTVSLAGTAAFLTPTEVYPPPRFSAPLPFFGSHPRFPFSRSARLDRLWDVAYEGAPSPVTVHVRRLREKIEDDPAQPRRLVTVWGAGYRFEP